MIMSLPFLDIELDLDLRPETLDTLILIPGSDLELDAPRYLFTLREAVHDILKCLIGGGLPFFYPAIFVGEGVEDQRWLRGAALCFSRVGRCKESQRSFELRSWSARKRVEHMACDRGCHLDKSADDALQAIC